VALGGSPDRGGRALPGQTDPGSAPVGGLQRFVTLAPAPESASQARRFVAEVLAAAGATSFVDTAALLTSELVTNGIVHAHTELQVVVDATPRWVRVEVVDGNPMLPARRAYDEEAPTGRGLEMVELLADDFGVQPLDNDGKRVWFRLGADAHTSYAAASPVSRAAASVAVHLVNLPVTLYNAWQAHADAMLREATLVALDQHDGELPEEFAAADRALAALAGGTRELFDRASETPDRADVELDIPRELVADFPVLQDLLSRCSERSAAGELLVPPSLPEIQAVRRWVCDEIANQAQGLSARAWEQPSVADRPLTAESAGIAAAVRRSSTAQVAADDWNRIIAVSPSAAALLGWSAAELEGRRLVTIIPPHLRDAHVAGFTRHMLGGAPRLLGATVEVPALHRSGREVPITLSVERHSEPGERSLYIATLEAGLS
jgi:PAS domain S-box-containing protein